MNSIYEAQRKVQVCTEEEHLLNQERNYGCSIGFELKKKYPEIMISCQTCGHQLHFRIEYILPRPKNDNKKSEND